MYDDILRLYVQECKLNIRGLENAITKGWITEEQKEFMIESKGGEICLMIQNL